MKKIVRWVPAAWLICFIVFVVWHEIAFWTPTQAKVSELEAESKLISAPASDVVVEQSSTHKSGQVVVDREYKSGLNYLQLRAYYDVQLLGHGWTLEKETPIRDWGTDLGGRSAYYKKDDDIASLQYSGDTEGYGWTYAISFSWGLRGD